MSNAEIRNKWESLKLSSLGGSSMYQRRNRSLHTSLILISYVERVSVSGNNSSSPLSSAGSLGWGQHVDNHRHGERGGSAADRWSRWGSVGAAEEPDDDRDAPFGFEGAPQLDHGDPSAAMKAGPLFTNASSRDHSYTRIVTV
eukprot:scaffold16716_cov146-Skeletonema_dohrnii-CCMP3373.AAC.22